MRRDETFAWRCKAGHLTTTNKPTPPRCEAPLIKRGKPAGLCGEPTKRFELRKDWQ